MKLWQWFVALLALLLGACAAPATSSRRGRRRPAGADRRRRARPSGEPRTWCWCCSGIACLFAIGFVVAYAEFSPTGSPTSCSGSASACRLRVRRRRADGGRQAAGRDRGARGRLPARSIPSSSSEVAEIVHESGSRITRKRLLLGAGAATGGALGLAALTPALSLGPVWDTGAARRDAVAARRRGWSTRTAARSAPRDIEQRDLLHRLPRGRRSEDIGSPLVIVRLDPAELELPAGRGGWAPDGILAYSKICTHAGCAIALYRKPTFPGARAQRRARLPCHYSTFDPATGGTVIYGPAGRPLPQLPLMIDGAGNLRAAGNFSGRVGPSWWGVREAHVSRRDMTDPVADPVRFIDERTARGAAAAQDAALPVPRPLVVPARRGRAVRVHRPDRHRHLPGAVLRPEHRQDRLPRPLRAARRARR